MTNRHQQYRTQLQIIAEQSEDNLRRYVARYALEAEDDDLSKFFSDLNQHGCISGLIGTLIYYHDTHAFFDRYNDEIEVLREKHEFETGEPLSISGDLKNCLAWFAFEETAYQITTELGLS